MWTKDVMDYTTPQSPVEKAIAAVSKYPALSNVLSHETKESTVLRVIMIFDCVI